MQLKSNERKRFLKWHSVSGEESMKIVDIP